MSEFTLSSTANPPEPTQEDRRTAERHPSALQLFCQPGTGRLDQFWWMGRLKDISTGGFGLMTRQQFDPGTTLSLEVKTLEDCNALPPEARVVRASPLPNGRWLIGCVFPQALSDEELRALVQNV